MEEEQQRPKTQLSTGFIIFATVLVTAIATIILFVLVPALFGYHVVLEPQ